MTEPVGQSPEESSHQVTDCDHGMTAHDRLGCRHCACRTPGFGLTEVERDRILDDALRAARAATVRPPGDEAGLRAAERLINRAAIALSVVEGAPAHAVWQELIDWMQVRAALAAEPDQEAGLRAARFVDGGGPRTAPYPPIGVEPTDTLAADLYACSPTMLRIVADFLLEHGWTEPLDDEGTEAALAAEPDREEPGLDVDRLARAMARLAEVGPPAHMNPDDAEDHWPSYRVEAEDIADEYARLANPDTGS